MLPQNPSEGAQAVREAFDAARAAAESRSGAAESEIEALREQLAKQAADAAASLERDAERTEQHAAEIREVRAQGEGAAAAAATEAEQTAQQLFAAKAEFEAELEALRARQVADQEAIAKVSASLQSTERHRLAAVARVTQLEEALAEEERRGGASLSDANMMRTAIAKLTREKVALWDRVQTLKDLCAAATALFGAAWQPDAEAVHCLACTKEASSTAPHPRRNAAHPPLPPPQFTLVERRHHCRICGQIFCKTCTPHTALLASSQAPQRVCKQCSTTVTSLKEAATSTLDPSENSAVRAQ